MNKLTIVTTVSLLALTSGAMAQGEGGQAVANYTTQNGALWGSQLSTYSQALPESGTGGFGLQVQRYNAPDQPDQDDDE
jgi:hypothetical protein